MKYQLWLFTALAFDGKFSQAWCINEFVTAHAAKYLSEELAVWPAYLGFCAPGCKVAKFSRRAEHGNGACGSTGSSFSCACREGAKAGYLKTFSFSQRFREFFYKCS